MAGEVDNRVNAILDTLAADGELVLQLALSVSAVAPNVSTKPSRLSTRFLRIIIYGPRKLLGELGNFVTECGCYLEDPVGCDRNVPYMNPQLLSSIHERPSMTFDLQQLQLQSIEDFTRASSDVLAGFETTDSIEESADPRALCTDLKPYVRETGRR